MNRHERRAAAKREGTGNENEASVPPSPPAAPTSKPSFVLKVFARILLADWVLRRVHHPDVIGILLQVAEQTGRTDAVVRLTTKLYSVQR